MALKEEKVHATSGKKKANVRRETSAVSGMRVTIVHNKKTNPKAATPSEPSTTRGRSVSRKRSIKGKSDPGIILRQPCRYYLKGTCTRSPCEYGHPPECHFYKSESGCKFGNKCSILRTNRIQSPNRVVTKVQWLSARCRQLGCVSQDAEPPEQQRSLELPAAVATTQPSHVCKRLQHCRIRLSCTTSMTMKSACILCKIRTV